MTSTEEKEIELIRQFKLYMSNPENVVIAANSVFEKLVDEIILGIVFDVHHAAKTGLFDLDDGNPDEKTNSQIADGSDVDIFGQQPIKKAQECICYCPTCKHSLAASRFAPHLAKCMGMGRNSSRIASRRIANNSKESVAYSGMMSDDEDDADWTASSDRRRKKRDRNGTRRSKNQKTVRNGDVTVESNVSNEVSSSNINSSNMNYDGMTYDEKKNLLMQICGVISEHTRRLCTRSMRCPQHSDEQRRAVRASLLGSQTPEVGSATDMIQVDVDTYDEGDGQSMRESLGRSWEQEHSNTSSPADSASTSSSSSKKREKLPKSKSKSSKSHKSSPSFPNNNHHSQGD
ncbi:ataxin-7-like protein 3 [Periplaneta americana]|uniref:ataxin-7-like protein 3 n=1 Tax=Periplaneta americana TaxID=6978 RepID=UPI0037E84115